MHQKPLQLIAVIQERQQLRKNEDLWKASDIWSDRIKSQMKTAAWPVQIVSQRGMANTYISGYVMRDSVGIIVRNT